MSDVLMMVLLLAVFALAGLYVWACDGFSRD
jgi:hypothetical protein